MQFRHALRHEETERHSAGLRAFQASVNDSEPTSSRVTVEHHPSARSYLVEGALTQTLLELGSLTGDHLISFGEACNDGFVGSTEGEVASESDTLPYESEVATVLC